MSMFLIIAGSVGLAICGVVRIAPWIKSIATSPQTTSNLVDVVKAYKVLHDALAANGNEGCGDELRTKIIPAALIEFKDVAQ